MASDALEREARWAVRLGWLALLLWLAAFARGIHTGVAVVVLLLAVREAVDAVVAPLVFRNLLRLHPVVVIASVLIGTELFGVLGTLLAAPAATAVATLLRSLAEANAMTGS